MRLDKFLKNSRIIKRRTLAKSAADSGRVKINEKVAKASSEVAIGDILEIQFGDKLVKVEVLTLKDSSNRQDAEEMIRVIGD